MGKKKKTASRQVSGGVGDALFAALTQREVGQLIDAFFEVLPTDSRERVLAQLGLDTRKTVEQVLSPPAPAQKAKAAKTKPVSMAKLAQTWADLWREWDDVVQAAAEEDGDYIAQEADWEPPYFDDNAFVEDLEKIAKKMRPLIQAAFEEGFEPDMGFAQALDEAEEEVAGGMPEWMEITEGFYLEKDLTACFLEWEWLKVQAEDKDGFAFARRILDWEDAFAYVALDDDAFFDFFAQLPEAEQSAIFNGLSASRGAPPWDKWLKNAHSRWHALYMYYAETREPEQYLDDLRATISQQWENGLPVIEALLGEKNYEKGLQVVEETLEALLSDHREKSWVPEKTLLFPIVSGWYSGDNHSNEKTLLRFYQQVAKGLGQTQRVAVLEIQRKAFNHFFDWEKMFKALEEPAVPAEIRQALFESWRDHIAKVANPNGWGYDLEKTSETWWVHWLIDSIFDAEKGAPWFQSQMDQWLVQTPQKMDASIMSEHAGFLRLLTKDLTEMSKEGKALFLMFHKTVIERDTLSTPDEKSRCQYLKVQASDDLLPRVMAIWKAHLHTMVPDPTRVHKADYTAHAQWMATLKELVPESYRALLKDWRTTHERRRNLWQAMAKMGLE